MHAAMATVGLWLAGVLCISQSSIRRNKVFSCNRKCFEPIPAESLLEIFDREENSIRAFTNAIPVFWLHKLVFRCFPWTLCTVKIPAIAKYIWHGWKQEFFYHLCVAFPSSYTSHYLLTLTEHWLWLTVTGVTVTLTDKGTASLLNPRRQPLSYWSSQGH